MPGDVGAYVRLRWNNVSTFQGKMGWGDLTSVPLSESPRRFFMHGRSSRKCTKKFWLDAANVSFFLLELEPHFRFLRFSKPIFCGSIIPRCMSCNTGFITCALYSVDEWERFTVVVESHISALIGRCDVMLSSLSSCAWPAA